VGDGDGGMRPVPIGFHELPETLAVWRPTKVTDEWGGETVTPALVGTVRAKVSQPAAAEQIEAQQASSTMTMIVHMRPDADVRRGDELRRTDGDVLRVKYTMHPSEPVYLRADCEQIQAEGQRELP
jgi:SPP1 family predicted phage head-tail adaptor